MRLASGAILAAVLLYLGVNVGLTTFARQVEAAGFSHPYPAEDWLRYLVPTTFAGDPDARIMLIGPSSVREALLYDRFNEAFPHLLTRQHALGQGTFEDMLLGLEYVEGAYGPEAIASTLVVGLSPRFAANLPPDRPFTPLIDRYSRHYSTERVDGGLRLREKDFPTGLAAGLRFRTEKQVDRYQSAVWGAIAALAPERGPGDGPSSVGRFLLRTGLAVPLGIEGPLRQGWKRYARFQAAPYKWHALGVQNVTAETIRESLVFLGVWPSVFRWDPKADERRVLAYFDSLHDMARRLDVDLFFVDMPENPVLEDVWPDGVREAYGALIRRGVGDAPFLDLHDFVTEGNFYDMVHPDLPSSSVVTDSVISFMKITACKRRDLERLAGPCPHPP